MARKRRIKKFVDNLKKKVKKAGGETKKALGYAPLLPFKPLMVNALKRKGENVKLSTKMDILVPLFRERIILKKTKVSYENLYLENLDPDQISSIVTEVLDFIKSLTKKAPSELSEEENNMKKDGDNAADKIAKGEEGEGGNWFKQYGMYMIAALAVIVVVYFVAKKK